MHCRNLTNCLEEIRSYMEGDITGYPLLVNTQNYRDYHALLQRMEQDVTLEKVFVSALCNDHGLPLLEDACTIAFSHGCHVLVGISQAAMLRGRETFQQEIQQLAHRGTRGHTVVLLEHAASCLEPILRIDPRTKYRILLWEGTTSHLPRITIVNPKDVMDRNDILPDVKGLMAGLEQLEEATDDTALAVATGFSLKIFAQSMYPVQKEAGLYDKLRQKFPEIAAQGISEANGSEEDWRWLSGQLASSGGMANLVQKEFGAIGQLEWQLPNELNKFDERRQWLYWLFLRIYPPRGAYFQLALTESRNLKNFEQRLYMAILDIPWDSEDFDRLYRERKAILERLPINQKLIIDYCRRVGKWDAKTPLYLTDRSEAERLKLLQCLESYRYEPEEINRILEVVAPELALYLKPYTFTDFHTGISGTKDSWLKELTDYFTEYKMQKVTNQIHPGFLEQVEAYATERPYNKLLPRMAVLSQMHCREAEAYFFDALGVEYLTYIAAKCEELGLDADIRIARAELPSITSMNKDFYQYFKPEKEILKIDDLDECKHHSKKFDYQKRKEPLHLFDELSIIDEELKNIYGKLCMESGGKAVIVSDHGASRLAVIYESENAAIVMEEKGQHSGRCAPANEEPGLEHVTYENGFAVLANYDRFKGGRRADVEVHGGATLEEVVVPVILLSVRGEKPEYSFVNPVITFRPGQDARLSLFCSQAMQEPRLKVNNRFYEGSFTVDKQHADFHMEGIRRKGKYAADVYEGSVSQGIHLTFEIQKQTQEDDLGI